MLDGFSPEQVQFIRDNFDCMWFVYHNIGSHLPIHMDDPPSERVLNQIDDLSKWKQLQKEKFEKRIRSGETMEAYKFWVGRNAGIYKLRK